MRSASPLISGLLLIGCAAVQPSPVQFSRQPVLPNGARLTVNGLHFRDLNRDGMLEPYEDWRLSPQVRAADLVSRMSVEEKVGAVLHGTAPSVGGDYGEGTRYDLAKAREIILGRHVTTMVTRLDTEPAEFARQNNLLQDIAAQGRLGIPVALSSDPRNHFQFTPGASVAGKGYSKWPETTGFAAIDEPALSQRFGEILAQEYRATGIAIILGPQADIPSEPRWPRFNGTFGEDPRRIAELSAAQVAGMQGGRNGPRPGHVAAVIKHWAGYGAAADQGYDSHNSYGRHAALAPETLKLHMDAFKGAFGVKVAGVMPTYSIIRSGSFNGKPIEQVGSGYSHVMLRDALRDAYAFKGMVVSDFAITDDCNKACLDGAAAGEPFGVSMAWGVESLSKPDRFALGLNAGLDSFGGTEENGPLIEAVSQGKVPIGRLDEAARHTLTPLFAIGLFENPFVDPAAATLARPEVQALARRTQARAMVPLAGKPDMFHLAPETSVYLEGVGADAARKAGLRPVATPAQAHVAIVRIHAPYQSLHPGYLFGSFQHEGDLDFKPDDPQLQAVRKLSKSVPVITVVYLDRPAILTEVKQYSTALLAEFGAGDDAVLDVLTGRVRPTATLPFELPRDMAAVERQRPDRPHDSVDPLYPMGYRCRKIGIGC